MPKPSSIDHFCKLNRAARHLTELDAVLEDFLRPDCYEIVNESEIVGELPDSSAEPRRGRVRRKVQFKRTPPLLYWGTIVGDVVHNLRAALDHLVFIISYRNDPATFAEDKTTAFPICDSPSDFRGPKRRGWETHHEIRGLPEEAKTIIEGLQPFQGGNEFLATNPLRILREMDDIDKHRTIHLTGWSAHTVSWDVTHVPQGVHVHSLKVHPPGPIESGAVLAELEITSPADIAALYTDKEFLFTIAFDIGTPLSQRQVQDALWELYFYTEGVLNALNRFVPSKTRR